MRRYTWFIVVLSLLSALAGARAGTQVDSFISPLKEVWGGTHQTSYTTGDIPYASGTDTLSKLAIGSTSDILKVVSGVPAWQSASSSVAGTAIYGDGSDGSLTYDGSTTILGMAPASNVYTLTRDITATSITVNSTVIIKTNGFRIFGTGTLTNNGTIQWDGSAGGTASGSTAGGAGAAGSQVNYLLGGAAGGAGGSGTPTIGSAGTSIAINCIGGAGGKGATGTSTGGAAGTATAPINASISHRSLTGALTARCYHGSAPGSDNGVQLRAGAGGGGGGGASTRGGGGGGGGGGIVIIAFKTITNNSVISANGGAGGSGIVSSGKGAGGGGGCVMYIYNTFSGNTPTASAGASGTTGSSTALTSASAGTVVAINNNQ